ncbi:hypothetical protein [Rudaeicoccus suwonensis]|uniref:ABC-2 type transport system permease protein n=1 Tax=Rudaeicoccus suwonensis TaxID=657409 RepID=A0A561EAX4_9MICO|nr:hypothetical protein [Rudaeicoccus suwonensis]TWE12760.1 ABC-2 type transport system permease protein [Rudaeicoccus suwonensis]
MTSTGSIGEEGRSSPWRDALAGTSDLIRLALRTERMATPVGVLVVPVLLAATAASLAPLYPDRSSREALATGAGANPVFRILLGSLRDTSGIGPIAVWRIGMFALLIAAVIAAATVTRNLRGPESSGRLELVRAGAVGSAAPVVAAAVVAGLAAIAGAVLTGVTSAVVGVSAGSAALVTVQFLCAGLMAVGVALVVDQVVTTSRTSIAVSSSLMLTAYLLRGIGDADDTWRWLVWVSPLGWAEHVDPFGARSVAPVLPCLLVFGAGVWTSATIARRRDLGAGLIASKPGRPTAWWPVSIFTVTVRTTGAALTPWLSGAFGYCVLVGLLTNSIGDLVGSGGTGDLVRKLGGGAAGAHVDLVTAVLNTVIAFVAVAATAAAVTVSASLRDADRAGHAEVLLSTGVSPRRRLVAAVVMAAAAALTMLLSAAGMMLGAALSGGHTAGAAAMFGAVVAQWPPTMAVAAVAFAAYGLDAAWIRVGWLAVVADLLLGPLGELLAAPRWLRDISPHAHVPAQIGAAFPTHLSLVFLLAAVIVVALGSWAVGRRDLG